MTATCRVRIMRKRSGTYTLEAERPGGGWGPLVAGNRTWEEARSCASYWPNGDLVWTDDLNGTLRYEVPASGETPTDARSIREADANA